jgi:hypothetical protein
MIREQKITLGEMRQSDVCGLLLGLEAQPLDKDQWRDRPGPYLAYAAVWMSNFDDKPGRYVGQGRPLQRIHTTAMTYGDMTEYALKAFKKGRVSYDNILVLPRAVSELPSRKESFLKRQ